MKILKKATSPPAYLEDEQIIALFFDRNEAAITETDRKYGSYLLSIAYNILHDPQDCEECQNDTYLNAWNSIPPAHPKLFAAYLVKIIRGLAINRWRRDRREKRIPPEATESLSDFAEFLPNTWEVNTQMNAQMIGNVINQYLRHTSQRKRYIFLSRYYSFRSIESIATALSVSTSTVKKDLQAIKAELRKKLEREGIDL